MTSLRRRHCWSIWPAFEPTSDVFERALIRWLGSLFPVSRRRWCRPDQLFGALSPALLQR